jgi:ABC-2 type transport system permease protein
VYKLIRLEWIKTFGKWRTYIGFIAIFIVLPFLYIGLKLDRGRFLTSSSGFSYLEQNFLIVGNLLNGYFVSQLVMYFLMVHVPFFIALVAGDQIAGEATAGTLRMILIKPPSRIKILTSKAIITIIYTIMLVISLAILSLGLGIILFGTGDMLVRTEGLLIIPENEIIYRFMISYLLAIIAMGAVAALAFLLSVMVENAIGPIIGTMAIIVVCLIISETPISLFEKIRPFIFTSYTTAWQMAFLDPIPYNDILFAVLYLFIYMLIFFVAAFAIFDRKDVLT